MLLAYYDLETTGTKAHKHSLVQLAMILEENGIEVDRINLKVRPHPKALIEKEALAVIGKTEEELMSYTAQDEQLKVFVNWISTYINPYDKENRPFLVGYNNAGFDNKFLSTWFELNDQIERRFSYFWGNTIDVMVMATDHLKDVRHEMINFKMHRVAEYLGIEIDNEKLHDAFYDTILVREIYKKLQKL